MQTIYESEADKYVLCPVESPLSKSDAKDIAARSRALAHSGQTAVYKGRQRVGTMVDICTWCYKHRCQVQSGDGVHKADLRFPAGTVYCGIELNEKGWAAHRLGELELDDLRVSGRDRSRTSIADLVGGVRKYAESDGAREGGGYHHDPYAGGDEQPPNKLLNPDDASELSPYGLADVNSIPLAAQAQALNNSYQALGPAGFHAHLRQHPPEFLHAVAAHRAIQRHPALHSALLAAAADNGHETPLSEREVDSYSPAMREGHEIGHHGEHQTGNSGLQAAYVGSDPTQPVNTAAPEEMKEGIDLLAPSNQSPSATWRYAPQWPDPKKVSASRAAQLAVHPQAPTHIRLAYRRRAQHR